MSLNFARGSQLASSSQAHNLWTLPPRGRGITNICDCGFKGEVLRGIGKLFAEAFDSALLKDGQITIGDGQDKTTDCRHV